MAYLTEIFHQQLFRFLIVGAINTFLSYCAYSFFLLLGFVYQMSSLLALIVGILISFKTQGLFVFKNSDNTLLGRYIICWILIYILNITLIKGILILGLDPYSSGALAIFPTTLLSYFAQKLIVFRRIQSSQDVSENI